jgi:DNA-binding MarR family transcriptional regulator
VPTEPLESTGYLLRLANDRAERVAASVIPAPFHIREIAILSMLEACGPMSQQELAVLGKVNRTIMVKLVDELERRGLVRRKRNPADRRSYALEPTTEGLAALRVMRPKVVEGESIMMRGLTHAEQRRLVGLLRSLLEGTRALHAGPSSGLAGYLITHAHYDLRRRAREVLSPLNMEPRHVGTLAVLRGHEPCSQQQLADALRVTPPVVVKLVDELAARQLVRRARNRSDRRANEITLSARGRSTLTTATAAVDEVQRFVTDKIGRQHRDELDTLLRKVIERPA